MLTCNGCHREQYNGTIFCSHCGDSLLPASKSERAALLKGKHGTAAKAGVAVVPGRSAPRELHATIKRSGRSVVLSLHEPILIGRAEKSKGWAPQLDLSDDEGHTAGVSRRHACIAYREGEVCVEDCGSSNGTWVNAEKLAPHTPHRLQPGDVLRLGSLLISIQVM